jgi:hypothetical protein
MESWTEKRFEDDFLHNFARNCKLLPVKKTLNLHAELFNQNSIPPLEVYDRFEY